MSTSPTRSAARCRRARARCWWWMPPRASRRRPWRTSTWRWSTTWRSSPSSTRSTWSRRSPTRSPRRSRRSWASPPNRCCASRPRTASTCEAVLEAVVHQVPPPRGQRSQPLRALIFDSHYDAYKGVIAYVRVVDGSVEMGRTLRLMSTGLPVEPLEIGVFCPDMRPTGRLEAGEVGYVATGLKTVGDCRVGDTFTWHADPAELPLPGYKPMKSMVFASVYPSDAADYLALRDALSQAPAQRRVADLPAGDQPGAGLRLPLRLPGPVPHGDRAGAAGARVRPRPGLHRAQRGVRGHADRRQRDRHRQPGRAARPDHDRRDSRAVGADRRLHARPSSSAR